MTLPQKNLHKKNIYIIAIILLFLITRITILFFLDIKGSDIEFYGTYAFEYALASQCDMSLYALHEKLFYARKEAAQKSGIKPEPSWMRTVAYPPLAVHFIVLPAMVIPVKGEYSQKSFTGFMKRYVIIYRCMCFSLECLAFLAMLFFIARIYSRERILLMVERLLFYIVNGLVYYHLLYDRLDLVLGIFIVFALILLVSEVHWLLSFLVLGLAVNFKLAPVVLLPVWVIGSMPYNVASEKITGEYCKNCVKALITGTVACILSILLVILPFFLVYGRRCLDFLSFHGTRGIHIESLYGSLLIIFSRVFGHAITIYHAFGGFNIRSSITPFLTHASTVVLALSVLVPTGLLVYIFTKRRFEGMTVTGHAIPQQRRTCANMFPGLFIGFSILVLLYAIAAAKVFSPSYLLWLMPLMALLPHTSNRMRICQWLFTGILLLSTIIFPYRYFTDIITGPTALGAFLLITRNLLFLVLIVMMTREWIQIAINKLNVNR